MSQISDPLPPLTRAERRLVKKFNEDPAWTHERLLSTLKEVLQVAVEVELSTIPIYLYSYYSIDRIKRSASVAAETNYTPAAIFANKAGGMLMSVAVEEMLHMSLSSNVLQAIGGHPEVYLKSPGEYPTNLVAHAKDGSDRRPLLIPLAKFSYEQLWWFLEIEFPEVTDAIPEDRNWQTIGQVYSYIRSLISSDKLGDEDFRRGSKAQQIQPSNYSPNNIDSVYPKENFNATRAPAQADSAAKNAGFANANDGHAGIAELVTIASKADALVAIATITDQGEGFGQTRFDDDSGKELSHYFKYLLLQSQLQGYPDCERLPKKPKPPPAAANPFSANDLAPVIYDFPVNPTTADYPEELQDISNFCNGLYQYMLLLTETIFKVPAKEQKLFFNRAMHLSMIWILDKLIQDMRKIKIVGGKFDGCSLAPTFENYPLGERNRAYSNLVALAVEMGQNHADLNRYLTTFILTDDIGTRLPDVSSYWPDQRFAQVPAFPANPPPLGSVELHSCMGLNSCKGHDRFGREGHPDPHQPGQWVENACAGQGYCSTTTDHTCHVRNNCQNQGGCGLYGTAEEQDNPGYNACQSLGSCATPINAERFSTDGQNTGKSVWLRARKVFFEKRWPTIAEQQGLDPKRLPDPPHPELFGNGPTFAWSVQTPDAGIAACGASGMSGAQNCV